MIEYTPLPREVLTAAQAVDFLSLDSIRSLERLVAGRRLCPLKLGKPNTFAVSELRACIDRELGRERQARRIAGELP